MGTLTIFLVTLGALAALAIIWRCCRWPCPSWLVPLLENPWFAAVAGAPLLMERAGVRPGMRVLDAGCGPGRLTLPLAERVGPDGSVLALDLQPRMLERLQRRLTARGIVNVELQCAVLGAGGLPRRAFDVAFLVTVLGEIRDQPAALREVHAALRPGGLLSITEVLPDPHYQPRARVRKLLLGAGFRAGECASGWLSFTLNGIKEIQDPVA